MDYGHQWTDKELKKLEKRIAKEYKQAAKEMQGKLTDYMQKFAVKDKKKLAQVQAGEITQSEYERWRTGQIAIGERWEEMKNTLAEDMLTTNRKVDSMTRQFSYDAYALNHNYGTFEAEKGSHVDTSYTLYDRNTVERLVRDNPDLLPPPGKKVSQDIKDGKLKKWNKQKIQSVMTQSILQGETIPQIAKRLATAVGDSNMKSAIRNARTMTTGAENAGRVDSYKRAVGMGIQMEQIWLATLDGRTRHEHRQLDGQKIKVGEKFSVDGYEIAFPGDPTAEAFLVYNCRCTLIGKVAGSDLDPLDMSQRNTDKMGMEYQEWKNAKAKKQKEPELSYEERKAKANEDYEKKIADLEKQAELDKKKKLDEMGGNFMMQRMEVRGNDSLSDDEKERLLEEIRGKQAEYNEYRASIDEQLEKDLYQAKKDKLSVYDVEKEFGKHSDKTIRDSVMAVNPKFSTFDYAYTNNCQRCSIAAELRMRGYSARAMGIEGYNGSVGAVGYIQDVFMDNQFETLGTGYHDSTEAVINRMKDFGDGSRGIICAIKPDGNGHVFNVRNIGGNVEFIDAQSGSMWSNGDGGFIEDSFQVQLLRTDNSKIYELPEGWVERDE